MRGLPGSATFFTFCLGVGFIGGWPGLGVPGTVRAQVLAGAEGGTPKLAASVATARDLGEVAVDAGTQKLPASPNLTAASADAAQAAAKANELENFALAESLATAALDEGATNPDFDPIARIQLQLELARALLSRRMTADPRLLELSTTAFTDAERLSPPQSLLLADAHRVVAWGLYSRADVGEEFLTHARKAIALADVSGDSTTDIVPMCRRFEGVYFELQGQWNEAVESYRKAHAARTALRRPRDRHLPSLHLDVARVASHMFNFDLAKEENQLALEETVRELGPEDPFLASVYSGQGNLAWTMGDFVASVDLHRRALDIALRAAKPDSVEIATHQSRMAWGLTSLGDYREARRALEASIPVLEKQFGPVHPRVTIPKAALLQTCVALRDTAAVFRDSENLRRAFSADSTSSQSWHLGATDQAEAELLLESNPRAALASLERSESIVASSPESTPTFLLQRSCLKAIAHAGLGQWSEAERYSGEALNQLRDSIPDDPSVDVWAREKIAGIDVLRGRSKSALQHLLHASRLSRAILLQNARGLSDRDGLRLSAGRVPPLYQLLGVVRSSLPDSASAAWNEMVNWRGLLTTELAARRPPPELVLTSKQREAFTGWVKAKANLARHETSLAQKKVPASSNPRWNELYKAANQAEAAWAREVPREKRRSPEEVGVEQVRAALLEEESLLSFAMTTEVEGSRLIAFVAQGSAPHEPVRLFDLGPIDAVDEAVEVWRREASRTPRGKEYAESACRATGERLRKLIWDPLAPELAHCSTVFLVADGPLHQVVWGALPVNDDRYLVEEGPTFHVLSAERDLLRRGETGRAATLLAFGGPDYNTSPASLSAASNVSLASGLEGLTSTSWRGREDCAGQAAPRFTDLPGARSEVDEIAKLISRAHLVTGIEAAEAAFKELAPGNAVIHVATHGFTMTEECVEVVPGSRGVGGVSPVDATALPVSKSDAPASPPQENNSPPKVAPHKSAHPETPLERTPSPWLGRRTYLAFAGANVTEGSPENENDGWLTADEVSTLDLSGTEWVVLSACRSGAGDAWATEGSLGMRHAFRLAGSRAVIAAEWDVDDDTTKDWMAALYRARLAGDHNAAEATRSACRAILDSRRADGRPTHPFYWAGFTSLGD